MSAADEAFKRARDKIIEARDSGAQMLSLDDKPFRALTRLPDEIADCTKLHNLRLDDTLVSDLSLLAGLTELIWLSLNGTQVSDLSTLSGLTALRGLMLNDTLMSNLSPLAELTALEALNLNRTQVNDLSPLSRLTKLEWLLINRTQVRDLSPLSGLTALERLHFTGTQVSDLSPLSELSALHGLNLNDTQVSDLRPVAKLKALTANRPFDGISFKAIPALDRDPQLRALSEIENNQRRTHQTLDYLRTLPPYPQPMPWQQAKAQDVTVPDGPAGPLQVEEQDGVLRPISPPADQEQQAAEQAWAALRDFLDDLAAQRGRIGNSAASLGRALDRLDAAMAQGFADRNAIAMGIHGSRVIALAGPAAEALMPEDAAEIEAFAAALSIYLEQFPEWRAYRDGALAAAPAPVAEATDEIDEITNSLKDRNAIDPLIPETLELLEEAARDAPDAPLPAAGLRDSLANVLSALGRAALVPLRGLRRAGGAIIAETSKVLTKRAGASLATVAYELFVNKAAILHSLAAKFPELLGWLTNFLRAFGL